MSETKPKVAILMGSQSDEEAMKGCGETLTKLGIDYEQHVMSAHRQPERVSSFARGARDAGFEVMICAAGMAAALPGVVAAHTTVPVIGVPLAGSALNGVDALYAIVQMPPGVPVACVAIGSAGARNAAYLAAQILGLKYEAVRQAYDGVRAEFLKA